VPDDSRISAIPGQLLGWASWGAGLNADLQKRSHTLYEAIDALVAWAPDPAIVQVGASDFVSHDVFNYAMQNGVTDAWVGQVGQAFLRIETRGVPGGILRANYQDFLNGVVDVTQGELAALVSDHPSTANLTPMPANPADRQAWWAALTESEKQAYLAYDAGDVGFLATAAELRQAGFKNLQDVYAQQSFIDAGIDPSKWDPSKGLKANDSIVQAVYSYYQHLWDENHNLQWAGMAKLAGATVYGGLIDMYALSQGERDPWEHIGGDLLGFALGGPFGVAASEGAQWVLQHEAGYFQTQFLKMQKDIFLDMGWQHAAFAHGGMAAITALHNEDPIGDPHRMDNLTYAAWQDIASGIPARIQAGNTWLLHREQYTVIQHTYDALRSHNWVEGKIFTMFTSQVAKSPIPGGKSFRDVSGGDVTTFDDRWNWISGDMMSSYQRLLANPGLAQQVIDTPLGDRAQGYRTLGDLHVDGY
jgi:hypothetical protein